MDIDYEKLSDLVVDKLTNERPARNDEEFAVMLAEKLIEHRSPCHDLSDDEIHTLKNIIQSKMRLAKTKTALKLGVCLILLRESYTLACTFIKENLHWGP